MSFYLAHTSLRGCFKSIVMKHQKPQNLTPVPTSEWGFQSLSRAGERFRVYILTFQTSSECASVVRFALIRIFAISLI